MAIVDRRRRVSLMAKSLPRRVVRYKFWIDDMGGSRSKKYSPFLNVRIVSSGKTISSSGPVIGDPSLE